MKKREEFYVGYLDKAPKSIAKHLRWSVPIIILLMVAIGFILNTTQPDFSESSFEFGIYKEVTGVIYQEPYPMIKVYGKNGTSYKSFLLTVFGKDNPRSLLKDYETQLGKPLENFTTTLKGSLIYYDGKTMMELDDGLASFIKSEKHTGNNKRKIEALGQISLRGEILDTKCFFGVMKPAFGKSHRSCAVRCISGGIPPAIGVAGSEGYSEYVLITDENGKAINQDILSFVGKQVEVSGTLEKIDDWKVLKLAKTKTIAQNSPNPLTQLLSYFSQENECPHHPGKIASCAL